MLSKTKVVMIVITVQYTKKERVQKNTFPKNKIAYPAERKYFFASFPSNLLVRSINNAILKGNKCWIEISVFHTYINLQSNLSIKFSKLFVQILKKICSSSQKYLIKFSKRFGQILNNICAWIWEQFWRSQVSSGMIREYQHIDFHLSPCWNSCKQKHECYLFVF